MFSFCPFSFDHCIVCPSNYGFWLSLWYLQTILMISIISHSNRFPRLLQFYLEWHKSNIFKSSRPINISTENTLNIRDNILRLRIIRSICKQNIWDGSQILYHFHLTIPMIYPPYTLELYLYKCQYINHIVGAMASVLCSAGDIVVLLTIRIMCSSGATSLSVDCCFSELAL